MYSKRSNYILGFHGCDKSVRDKIINGEELLRKSSNDYDWLGSGIYFWENNYERALEYAHSIMKNPERCKSKITKPAVLGAVINLGYCLDLLESRNLQILKAGFEALNKLHNKFNLPMPENKPIGKESDLIIRKLDCAVIETVHQNNKEHTFDSVRAVFFEGKDLYPNAGFKEKNHIQICVRNPNCIKGLFIPRELDEKYSNP
jgi:hypothetical protein